MDFAANTSLTSACVAAVFAAGFTNTNALFFRGGFATAVFAEAAFAGAAAAVFVESAFAGAAGLGGDLADLVSGFWGASDFLGSAAGLSPPALDLCARNAAAPRATTARSLGAILANGRGAGVLHARSRYASPFRNAIVLVAESASR